MKEISYREINLDNGYKVEIFDASKKIGIDASHVKLILRMNVPVVESLFKDDKYKEIDFKGIQKKLGDYAVFEIIKERNLIKIEEKEKIFQSLMDTFVETSLNYLAKEDFPAKFIIKQFNDLKY
ncbi:MAG: hypothetical protein GY760_12975 [Deltaproteobacteria bacterium]|nr:hypothetical protein [Deltaproteobacteria bacterium]